jgi:hypothetical protein
MMQIKTKENNTKYAKVWDLFEWYDQANY